MAWIHALLAISRVHAGSCRLVKRRMGAQPVRGRIFFAGPGADAGGPDRAVAKAAGSIRPEQRDFWSGRTGHRAREIYQGSQRTHVEDGGVLRRSTTRPRRRLASANAGRSGGTG